jgi:hypothetical protein
LKNNHQLCWDIYCTTYIRYASTSRRNSEGTLHERTPLLYPSLQKVDTCQSVMTVADSYAQHPHQGHAKSSFVQSIFNSINILIGVGILALPLGFKVRSQKGKIYNKKTHIVVIERWLVYWCSDLCFLLWPYELYSQVTCKVSRL